MATLTTLELEPLENLTPIPKQPALEITEHAGHTVAGPAPPSSSPSTPSPKLTPLRTWTTILQLSSINLLSSFSNGLLAIGLPTIASDLSIPPNLLLWPNSVFYLTSGSCLLIAGSLADVLGPKKVFLPGCLLVGVFMLLCGVARDGVELIMFRAMQGIATAMVLPSAVSIVSTNVEDGRPRNIGFAAIFLAMPLGFAVGMLSANTANIKTATGIALLVISLVLVPAFIAWMHFQEKRGKPALIPNSMWKNSAFTSVCLMIMLSSSVNSCLEIFCSLFFQQVQLSTPLTAGLKILPQVLTGALLNALVGTFVNKTPIHLLVLAGNILQAGSPLLMATINPTWPYWTSAFFAQLLAPLSVDILFTVGTIVVSNAFPAKEQALGGAVFNTFAQLGTSVGLCGMSVIQESVTKASGVEDKESPEAVMEGLRAAFRAMVGMMGCACVVGAVGLRRVGKVGVKRD
ncbi:hypothetical protein PRZ48_005363 [Zasmidium cellare]|uniref:Major facilitator superfamily (MFS) profile domain-containing protein n=1 Tax=Zasmidium cellare TaxID=395010 RepID=A0ABR0ESF3_ZASCE|nr:hypothetical protein PRZ48_005363 [Zasmidium cellare]